jgi:transcription elongation GreA/GreB family factor
VDKKLLIASIVEQLSTEMESIAKSAMSAHDEATHPNEKQENPFDTPGLETSYLAEGQVKVAAELREAADAFRSLELHEFAADEPITLGALVKVEVRGEPTFFVLGPKGGGIEVNFDGHTVTVLTAQSPLGRKLLGRHAGETIPADPVPGARPLKVLSVS